MRNEVGSIYRNYIEDAIKKANERCKMCGFKHIDEKEVNVLYSELVGALMENTDGKLTITHDINETEFPDQCIIAMFNERGFPIKNINDFCNVSKRLYSNSDDPNSVTFGITGTFNEGYHDKYMICLTVSI